VNNSEFCLFDQAITKARESDLDLVEVAPQRAARAFAESWISAKYKYEKKEERPISRRIIRRPKEIRLRPKTGDPRHRFQDSSRPRAFLEHKDKVVVSVVFRGRELAHIGRRQKK